MHGHVYIMLPNANGTGKDDLNEKLWRSRNKITYIDNKTKRGRNRDGQLIS